METETIKATPNQSGEVNNFKINLEVIWTYDVYNRETKKEEKKSKNGVIKSFWFNIKKDNPVKLYDVIFEDGSEETFLDKFHPDAKKYFGNDINELSLK